jgi:hypothetical protein
VLEAGWSGLNTRAGDLLTVTFKRKGTDANTYATKMNVVLVSDNILKISNTGVEVYG